MSRLTIAALGRSGDGIQFAGRVLAEAATASGLSLALFPEPAQARRGERSAFRLVVNAAAPLVPGTPDWLLATVPGPWDWEAGDVLVDTDRAGSTGNLGVPAASLAQQAGWPRGALFVLFGALSTRLDWLDEAAVVRALKEALPDQPRQVAQNVACFRLGRQSAG